MQILLFIFGLILFTGLVVVHEWGHYYVARRNGVKSEEFGLGLPPRAIGKKLKSGMTLSLNWLPIGGFVKLRGESDSDKRSGSFGAASLGSKSKIIMAGVAMNLIVGLLLLTFLAWLGMPRLITKDTVGEDQFTVASDTKIIHQDLIASYVEDKSPAASIGLSPRDTIIQVKSGGDVRNIKTAPQLKKATNDFAGQKVQVTYKHNGNTVVKDITLRSLNDIVFDLKKQAGIKQNDVIIKLQDPNIIKPQDHTRMIKNDKDLYMAAIGYAGDKIYITYTSNGSEHTKQATLNPGGHLGVVPTELQIRRSTWSAPIVAVGFTKQLTVLTFKGLGSAFSGVGSIIAGATTGNTEARQNGQAQATAQVGGPVAIGAVLWGSGSLGILFVLMIIAIISLTLALINALPIPALDGGRLALILFSRGLLKRPLSRGAEEKIVGTSMALILGLLVLISVVDVKRFF